MKNKSYTYNGFIYEQEGNKENDGVRIIHNKPYPDKVHKFYLINSYSVDALLNGYFYASHTNEINDVLDSSPFLWYASKPLSFDFYERFLDKDIPKEILLKFYDSDTQSDNLCKGYISLYFDVISNIFGIISLTADESGALMWAHYTQEKGFQLTFNADLLESSIKDKIDDGECFGMFPINYSQFLNPIDISGYSSMHIPFFYATNVKSDKWLYENEWRFLIGKKMMGVKNSKSGLNTKPDYVTSSKNRFTYYDSDLVEQITLGINFFTTQDFKLKWSEDGKHFKVSPKKTKNKCDSEFESYKRMLFYIYKNLKNKIYHSGIKYERDKNGTPFLIRTKERLDIEKIGWDTYVFTRTNEIIKIF